MTNVSIDGQQWMAWVSTARTVPRLIDSGFFQDGQHLSTTAGPPHWQLARLEHFLCASPGLTTALTPLEKTAGEKGTQRTRLGEGEVGIEIAVP